MYMWSVCVTPLETSQMRTSEPAAERRMLCAYGPRRMQTDCRRLMLLRCAAPTPHNCPSVPLWSNLDAVLFIQAEPESAHRRATMAPLPFRPSIECESFRRPGWGGPAMGRWRASQERRERGREGDGPKSSPVGPPPLAPPLRLLRTRPTASRAAKAHTRTGHGWYGPCGEWSLDSSGPVAGSWAEWITTTDRDIVTQHPLTCAPGHRRPNAGWHASTRLLDMPQHASSRLDVGARTCTRPNTAKHAVGARVFREPITDTGYVIVVDGRTCEGVQYVCAREEAEVDGGTQVVEGLKSDT